ncbi:hypothetical protein ACSBPH_01535 [Microbacterium sp. F51-2R]|uniref:hypothetical protein n=1 Tax=Microbacterium sp. F51-2R TaxID=3445777 RepID=UPI003F9FE448
MGWSSSGGPKGLGSATNTPSTQADFDKMIELIALMGNFRGGVSEAERDAITGDALFAGLLVYNTTKTRLEVWDGSGWDIVWPTSATGVVACPASGGGGSSPIFWSDLIDVTFPVGMFSSAPIVVVQTVGPAGQVTMNGMVEQITASGCKVRGMRIGSVPSNLFSVQWKATRA